MSDLSSLDIGPYDPYNDLVTIEGIRYSGQLLRDGLGVNGLYAGRCLRIVKREGGLITMQTLPDVDYLLDLLAHVVAEADGRYGDLGQPIEGDVMVDEARRIVSVFKSTGESNG